MTSTSTRRNRGEGSITRRHDHATCPPAVDGVRPDHDCQGRWQGSVDFGWHKGKRVRRTVYGRTKTEVVSKVRKLHGQDVTAARAATDAPTVAEWLDQWFTSSEPTWKQSTRNSYRVILDTYLIPALGKHRLHKLTPTHVERLYADLRARGLSEGSVHNAHAVLRRALTVAMRQQRVTQNVALMVEPPKVQHETRRGLSEEEMTAVLRTAGDDPRWWVALLCGLRQGEVLGLLWEDVDLTGPTPCLHVRRTTTRVPGGAPVYTTPKSKAGTRRVPLPTEVATRLAALRTDQPDDWPVFPSPGDPSKPRRSEYDRHQWVLLLARAGVEHTPLHAARNSAAQLLSRQGVAPRVIADILGHANVSMTYAYQRGDEDAKDAAMQGMTLLG